MIENWYNFTILIVSPVRLLEIEYVFVGRYLKDSISVIDRRWDRKSIWTDFFTNDSEYLKISVIIYLMFSKILIRFRLITTFWCNNIISLNYSNVSQYYRTYRRPLHKPQSAIFFFTGRGPELWICWPRLHVYTVYCCRRTYIHKITGNYNRNSEKKIIDYKTRNLYTLNELNIICPRGRTVFFFYIKYSNKLHFSNTRFTHYLYALYIPIR